MQTQMSTEEAISKRAPARLNFHMRLHTFTTGAATAGQTMRASLARTMPAMHYSWRDRAEERNDVLEKNCR
jgi:hypothetical protein